MPIARVQSQRGEDFKGADFEVGDEVLSEYTLKNREVTGRRRADGGLETIYELDDDEHTRERFLHEASQ